MVSGCAHGLARCIHQLELDWTLCLLLDDDSTMADTSAGNDVSDPDLNHITAT